MYLSKIVIRISGIQDSLPNGCMPRCTETLSCLKHTQPTANKCVPAARPHVPAMFQKQDKCTKTPT